MHFAFGKFIMGKKEEKDNSGELKEEEKDNSGKLKEEEQDNSLELNDKEKENSEELKKEENNNSEKLKEEILEFDEITDPSLEEWKIYPCERYNEEYKDCKSARARFHQMYVHGEHIDCEQWKIDAKNCRSWKRNGNLIAFEDLLKSVNNRRMERLRAHYGNNVWKKRDKPPSDWSPPLPDWMQEKMKNSYLALELERREKGVNKEDNSTKSCCIL